MADTTATTTTTTPAATEPPAKTLPETLLTSGDGQSEKAEQSKEVAATQQTQEGDSETKEGEAKAETAPPADIEIKLPEGVQADTALLDAFKPLAKEYGLDSEKAQKLVDLYSQSMARIAEQQQAQWQAEEDGWKESIKADKEIGGAAFEENLNAAHKAMARFATPELKEVLKHTRLGNHPEFIRLLAKVGKAISEDSVAGATRGGTEKAQLSEEDILRREYPSMFPASQ